MQLATHLNHKAIGLYQFLEKNSIRRISPPATNFFCVQDCSSWIVQVEFQGQTRNTRTLEHKPLIDTSYHILHILELKYFHFAQFMLKARQAAHQPRISEN